MCIYMYIYVYMHILQRIFTLQIPRQKVILSQLYCLVLFGLKIILKTCQKTDVGYEYVEKVIVGDYGEQIMKYCLKVAYNLLKDGIEEFKENQPDILSANPEIVNANENKFLIHLKKFVNDNMTILLLEEDGSVRQTRNTVSVSEEIDTMFQVVNNYVTKFWIEIRERIKFTDLSDGPTSFSEAPAESVFSVWERITSNRESLTIAHTIALVRVAMEGPAASTKASLNVSKTALNNWPSHLGERFTTANWKPGLISKTVAKIQKE